MMISQMTKLVLLFIVWGSLICLSSGISSKFSITELDLDKIPSDTNPFVLFQQWTDKYEKVYETLEELEKRFQIFKTNLKYMAQQNAKRRSRSSYRLGPNKFADLSPEEFRKIYLHTIELPTNTNHVEQENQYCSEPASFDWRNKGVVTPVKNQGQCGSCWAFSATGAMEGINAIMTGKLIGLSEQALVDCDPVSLGCDGGWVNRAFTWVKSNGGIDTEANYPYKATKGTCQTREKAVTIDGYVKVAISEDVIRCSLLQQPLSVYLDAADFQFYQRGILDGGNCSSDPYKTTHAVLIVGYGSEDGQDYWIVKNSWGQNWGEGGYIRIKRNTGIPNGLCAINAWVYYPTKTFKTNSSTIDTDPNFGYNNHYEE